MVRKLICGLFLLAGVAACGFTAAKQHGEALCDQYFAAAREGDTAAVLAMYDDAFYKAAPNWRDTYLRLRAKIGKPHTHMLANWYVTSTVGTSGAGQYVTLVYQVQYDLGRGTETIGVVIPAGSGRAGIRAHNFTNDALVR